ncbi:hypothetical protein IHE44_0005877 [Lamprotornis superbus]|uniref:Uncharacterized protein n=1 Tax=Lamprotornis superbus TaxID=245042 RepID=A0A835NX88_9PASS|nr:hypothetical protein IHE44_0005877 [Lamprotornis superbus]
MGGKNKQRTKGNLRPSSSGRAAELLAKERGTVPGFIGFGTSQSDLGYVPAIQGAEEIDSLVDADFRMVLRKLSKRDVTTKLKAMQEFGMMCKEREAEVVKGVLPYWPRIYCKISLDHDRRVREATQQSFEQLILKVKKHLAPYLKSIMGYWLIAQCDTYSPAASAAKVAFEKAFPSSKQPEALVFCKDEILNVLQDHLLKETADTLSDPQTVPEEEREAKFFRILTCSLLALKKLLSMLPKKEMHSLEEKLMSLLSQNKFWKYSKNSVSQVRSAFFELISAFCQHLPEVVKAEAPRVCPAVLLSIDDSDAVVCPALWEAVLYTVTTIEDCWSHVNARKGVLPKLWTVLREGGRGLATVIYPNLLPFISKVPPDVVEPKLEYFRVFFSSVIQGLSNERTIASPSESSAIITAFMECLCFAVLQKGEEDQSQIHQMLICDQLIPFTNAVLKEPKLQSGPLFYQTAEMLSSWEAKAELSSDDGTDEVFQKLLSDFWDHLLKMCMLHVDRLDADEKLLFAISGMLEILQNPKSATKPNNRKSLKIRFTDENESERNTESRKLMEVRNGDSEIQADLQQTSCLRKEPLENLVCNLAELSIVYVNEQKSEQHLKFLSALLNSFSSNRVFQVLLEQGNDVRPAEAESQNEVKAYNRSPSVQFLYMNLITWLKEDWRKDTHFLVDILYSVLHCCNNNDERKVILDDLAKMDLKWVIFLQIIQKSSLIRISLFRKVDSPELESLIGETFVERIIDKLQAALSKAKNLSEAGNTEPSVSFICDVASSFFSSVKGCLLMPSSEDLLLTIFQLCAQRQDATHLTDVLVCKLKHTWMSGVNSLVHQLQSTQKQSTFLLKAAQWVKNQVQSSSLDVKSLQVLISAVSDLLLKLMEADGQSGYLVRAYVEHVTPSKTEWGKLHESLCSEWMHKPLLEGRLSMNCEPLGSSVKLCGTTKLPGHLCTSALLSKMVLLQLKNSVVHGNDDAERKKIDNIKLLYSLQWIEELENPPYLLLEYLHMLEEMHITYEEFSALSSTASLQQTIFDRSEEHGRLWSLTMAKVIHAEDAVSWERRELFKTTEGFLPLTEGRLHTLQCLSPFLIEEEKRELVFHCVAKLMTCTQPQLSSADGIPEQSIYVQIHINNLKEASAQLLGFNIEMMRYLPLLLKYSTAPLADNEWDFLMCSMLAWLETTSESRLLYHVPLVQIFACVSCDLASALSAYFEAAAPDTTANLPKNLVRETKTASEGSFQNSVLSSLGEALTYISKDQLLNHKLPPKFVAGQKTNLPDKLQTLLNTLSPLLLFQARPVQVSVYHMLHKLMPELPKFDDEDLKSYGDEEEELALSPPAALMSILATQELLLENILECIPVGEFAVIQPLSDEFCLVLGYLLTWKLTLAFFKAASSQLRVLYSQYLRRTKSLNKLLYHLFRLMPENPVFSGPTSEVPNKDTKTFFTEELRLDVKGTGVLSSQIPHLACSVYHITLKDLPAMVRLWWNSCEKRVFNVVDKFTSKYVSNVLSSQEISSVQTSTQLFNGMTLPSNYPLGSITVESGKRVGVAVQQWRNWMLQLSTYLTHQNGSIMEGLSLWKNNVDKRFEGVEDCMICFSVIHGSNYSLPKKACRTCKKNTNGSHPATNPLVHSVERHSCETEYSFFFLLHFIGLKLNKNSYSLKSLNEQGEGLQRQVRSITCAVAMIGTTVGWGTASSGQGLGCPFPHTGISKCAKTLIFAVFHSHPLALKLATGDLTYSHDSQLPWSEAENPYQLPLFCSLRANFTKTVVLHYMQRGYRTLSLQKRNETQTRDKSEELNGDLAHKYFCYKLYGLGPQEFFANPIPTKRGAPSVCCLPCSWLREQRRMCRGGELAVQGQNLPFSALPPGHAAPSLPSDEGFKDLDWWHFGRSRGTCFEMPLNCGVVVMREQSLFTSGKSRGLSARQVDMPPAETYAFPLLWCQSQALSSEKLCSKQKQNKILINDLKTGLLEEPPKSDAHEVRRIPEPEKTVIALKYNLCPKEQKTNMTYYRPPENCNLPRSGEGRLFGSDPEFLNKILKINLPKILTFLFRNIFFLLAAVFLPQAESLSAATEREGKCRRASGPSKAGRSQRKLYRVYLLLSFPKMLMEIFRKQNDPMTLCQGPLPPGSHERGEGHRKKWDLKHWHRTLRKVKVTGNHILNIKIDEYYSSHWMWESPMEKNERLESLICSKIRHFSSEKQDILENLDSMHPENTAGSKDLPTRTQQVEDLSREKGYLKSKLESSPDFIAEVSKQHNKWERQKLTVVYTCPIFGNKCSRVKMAAQKGRRTHISGVHMSCRQCVPSVGFVELLQTDRSRDIFSRSVKWCPCCLSLRGCLLVWKQGTRLHRNYFHFMVTVTQEDENTFQWPRFLLAGRLAEQQLGDTEVKQAGTWHDMIWKSHSEASQVHFSDLETGNNVHRQNSWAGEGEGKDKGKNTSMHSLPQRQLEQLPDLELGGQCGKAMGEQSKHSREKGKVILTMGSEEPRPVHWRFEDPLCIMVVYEVVISHRHFTFLSLMSAQFREIQKTRQTMYRKEAKYKSKLLKSTPTPKNKQTNKNKKNHKPRDQLQEGGQAPGMCGKNGNGQISRLGLAVMSNLGWRERNSNPAWDRSRIRQRKRSWNSWIREEKPDDRKRVMNSRSCCNVVAVGTGGREMHSGESGEQVTNPLFAASLNFIFWLYTKPYCWNEKEKKRPENYFIMKYEHKYDAQDRNCTRQTPRCFIHPHLYPVVVKQDLFHPSKTLATALETRIHPVTFPSFLLCHSLFLALLNEKQDKEYAFPRKTCQGRQTKRQPSLSFTMKTSSTKAWKACKVCPSSLYMSSTKKLQAWENLCLKRKGTTKIKAKQNLTILSEAKALGRNFVREGFPANQMKSYCFTLKTEHLGKPTVKKIMKAYVEAYVQLAAKCMDSNMQFNCFICVAYSAGQISCTDALNVVDFQFTGDGHNPIFVLDSLLCRSRIEQVVPGDNGLWEAMSITDDYQMIFRNVVMDRCIETFQHTNETSHHHSEHLVISCSSSLTIRNQSKAYWIHTELNGKECKKSSPQKLETSSPNNFKKISGNSTYLLPFQAQNMPNTKPEFLKSFWKKKSASPKERQGEMTDHLLYSLKPLMHHCTHCTLLGGATRIHIMRNEAIPCSYNTAAIPGTEKRSPFRSKPHLGVLRAVGKQKNRTSRRKKKKKKRESRKDWGK